MPFDFKKEYREFYMSAQKPEIITIPKMNFIAGRGYGNPNEAGGMYQAALGALYAVAYTIKMSYKGSYQIKDFFEYVVPPLEGFWWQEGAEGIDYVRKENFQWISLIRLPDFVTRQDFDWAVAEAERKKRIDGSRTEFFTYDEGLCVQCMHIGAYDDEPETVAKMDAYAWEHGYQKDISAERFHHEIYLSDPRRSSPEKMKTIIRHPVKKK